MKTKTCHIVLLVLSLVIAAFASGCASGGSGPKGAYPTLRNTEVNVDWPMTRYNNAVTADRVTLGMQQEVNLAYTAYKQAFDAALAAANNNRDAHTPDNVQALANQLLTTLGGVPTF